MEIKARQVIDFIAKQAINVHSDKRIRLQVGPHRIEITPGGGIELFSPKPLQAHTGSVAFSSAQGAVPVVAPSFPFAAPFNEQFQAVNQLKDQPLPAIPFTLQLASGEVVQGLTDKNGKTPRIYGAQAETVELTWGGLQEEGLIEDTPADNHDDGCWRRLKTDPLKEVVPTQN